MALEDSRLHANDDYHDHNFCERERERASRNQVVLVAVSYRQGNVAYEATLFTDIPKQVAHRSCTIVKLQEREPDFFINESETPQIQYSSQALLH